MRRLLTLTTVVVVAAMPLAVRADPSGDLKAAADRFSHLKYWHARMTSSRGQTTDADFAAPDRFRITLPTGPAYFIGSQIYVSMGGRYMKIPVPQAAAMVQQLRSPAHASTFTRSHKIQDLGSSTVDGVAAHAYAFDDTTEGITTHDVIDVGRGDGLPHRATITSQQGTTVVRYGKFDVPVTITPPI